MRIHAHLYMLLLLSQKTLNMKLLDKIKEIRSRKPTLVEKKLKEYLKKKYAKTDICHKSLSWGIER